RRCGCAGQRARGQPTRRCLRSLPRRSALRSAMSRSLPARRRGSSASVSPAWARRSRRGWRKSARSGNADRRPQGVAGRAMSATIIDGKAIAAGWRGRVADAVHRLGRDRGLTPGLAVVLVGSNPASESYVGSKVKMTSGSGMRSFDHRLPQETTEAELLTLIGRLNTDPTVHGILVQLPLPPQIDPHKIIGAIDPGKDVDGFHP